MFWYAKQATEISYVTLHSTVSKNILPQEKKMKEMERRGGRERERRER